MYNSPKEVNIPLEAYRSMEFCYQGLDVLSRFKNGKVCLCTDDANRLEKYLSLVQIPTAI